MNFVNPAPQFYWSACEVLERMREQWFANVIHDLSNPLLTTRGYLRMMAEAPDGTESKRILGLALENLSRIVALIQELKDFPPKQEFRVTSFSFRDLVNEVIAEVRPNLSENRITARQFLSDASLITSGDREKLSRAVHGFFAAAIQTMNPGETLEIYVAETGGGDKINLRLNISHSRSVSKPLIELSELGQLWRLHGGKFSISRSSEARYSILCELPVISPHEPRERSAYA